ncbi:unnamed protein product [Arctogadus glacialis]
MRVLISGRSALVFIREEEWGTSRGASALSRRCDYGGVRAEMGPILLPFDICASPGEALKSPRAITEMGTRERGRQVRWSAHDQGEQVATEHTGTQC